MRESFIEVLPPFPQHIIPPKPKAPAKRVKVKRPGPIADALYKAVAHMQRHGYMHAYQCWDLAPKGPACFLGTIEHALQFLPGEDKVQDYFQALIFAETQDPFNMLNLARDGWNKKDAVAALRIAADYAAAEGV